jgi:hypothetical protein
MRKGSLASFGILVLLMTLGCDDGPTEPRGEPIAFQTIYASPHSGIETRRGEIIRDPSRWSAVWEEVHRQTSPQPPLPAVDFGSDMVILAAAGMREDSCWDVAVGAVASRRGTVAVSAEEIRRTGCACLAVIVHPVHVVRATRSDGSGRFGFAQRTIPGCP